MNTALSKLPVGEEAEIKAILVGGKMLRRLNDIGFVEGTRLKCLNRSKNGHIGAYMVRDAVIALRGEDSAKILVEEVR